MKDFFISYNGKDKPWAEWIAYQLEEASYTTVIQAWDFRPGGNFVLEMQKAALDTERTIAVLSRNYLEAEYTQPEWAAAFVKDSQGTDRKLIPVRIAECKPAGLLAPIIYIDLVGKDEQAAVKVLLEGISKERSKPLNGPPFPGQPARELVTGKPKPEFPGLPSVRSNLLYPRNPFFTGRDQTLSRLHNTLATDRVAVLSGLGGIGKTQTAVEYADRHRDEYKAVILASATTELTPIASYVEIAKILDLPGKDAQNQDDTVRVVKGWLENNSNWLLIFDNADKPEVIRPYFPNNPKGHILVTSRAQVFDILGVAKPIELEGMLPEEVIEFLFKRTGRNDSNSKERNAVEQIASELGYLPLALEQAGAYIARKQCSFQDYLISYRTRGLELLEKVKPVTGEYPQSVATTWAMNFEQVEVTSKAAADLLRFSAFLNPNKIPLELVTLGAVELGLALSTVLTNAKVDPLVLDEVLESLSQYSLIRRNVESQTYDVHRLVQAVLREGMDTATQRQWAERTVRALNRTFPDIEFSTWLRCERILPHAQAGGELIEKWRLEFREATLLLYKAGLYLYERARYAEAEPLHQRVLAVWEKTLGPEHPDVATCLNNLAALYSSQGKYAEAEPLFLRALAIRENTLGSGHWYVGQSLKNLAGLYRDQGRYAEAEPLFPRALEIQETALGPNHLEVANTLSNFAVLYRTQGQYAAAEPLYQRALAIREKALEPEHLDVARSLNNLAEIYYIQSQYAQAEPLYRRMLMIWEKKLGPTHDVVVTTLNKLVLLYYRLRKYDQAARFCEQILAIGAKTLGPDHLRIAEGLENYAALLKKAKKKGKAAKMEARAKAIRTKHAQRNLPKR